MRMPTVLKIGLDASQIDLRTLPGVTEDDIRRGGQEADRELALAGFNVSTCALFLADKEALALKQKLAEHSYDCIVVGAGLRTLPAHTVLFERVMNILRTQASSSSISFNTGPEDTLAAVQRSLGDQASV
ncbi:hypothetical protein ACS5PN_26900 [Roseateles sp. NT4]|uniref:hypothetical protein n=1 Tax=Roseateles sp. NT4 TaxID=3453715 RepID=UPI003EE85B1C